jgi:hypothetical protein
MKIRAKANGEILETDDAAAKTLIDAGIYEPVTEPGTSTTVEPLTTESLPVRKKGK